MKIIRNEFELKLKQEREKRERKALLRAAKASGLILTPEEEAYLKS